MKKILLIVLAVVLMLSLLLTSVVLAAEKKLQMYAWQVGCTSCGYNNQCWCGPSSGVSIGDYYKNYYKTKYSSLPIPATMYCQLYSHMDTLFGLTFPEEYGPGFVDVTKDYTYRNFGCTQDYFTQLEMGNVNDFLNIKDFIDKGWPVALYCGGQFGPELSGDSHYGGYYFPPPGKHWLAIKGYKYPYNATVPYAIICTDSYSKSDNLTLDWQHLGNCGADYWFFCAIKDTVAEDFEWGYDGLSLSGGGIGWSVQKAGSSVAEIDNAVAKVFTGTRSARVYRDGTNNVSASYSRVKPTYIGFYIKKEQAAYAYAYIGDGTKKIYTRIDSSQYLQYYDNTGWHTVCRLLPITYSWYFIEFKNMNWASGVYDISVDGDVMKSAASMQTTTADKDKMCFGSLAGSGSFWIDDISHS